MRPSFFQLCHCLIRCMRSPGIEKKFGTWFSSQLSHVWSPVKWELHTVGCWLQHMLQLQHWHHLNQLLLQFHPFWRHWWCESLHAMVAIQCWPANCCGLSHQLSTCWASLQLQQLAHCSQSFQSMSLQCRGNPAAACNWHTCIPFSLTPLVPTWGVHCLQQQHWPFVHSKLNAAIEATFWKELW